MSAVRAITLTQPWASLVAWGEKRVETRSWRTPYRGLLAIHAAVGLEPVGGMRGLVELIKSEPFAAAVAPHLSGYTAEERAGDLPRGAIVAVAELTDIIPTSTLQPGDASVAISAQERTFGDYRPGRYAWVLERVLDLHDGIECRGALGCWKLPREALDQLADVVDL